MHTQSTMRRELHARYRERSATNALLFVIAIIGLYIAFTLTDSNKMITVITCNALNDTPEAFSSCLSND